MVDTEKNNEIFIIRLKGDIDLHSSGKIKDAISWELDKNRDISVILFDFKEVSFVDSTGINILYRGIRNMDIRGGVVVLSSISEHIKKVLTMAGIVGLVRVYSSEKTALKSLKNSPWRRLKNE